MASTTTTLVGWSLIIGVGGVAYWQYSKSGDRRSTPGHGRGSRAGATAERPWPASKERQTGDKVSETKKVDSNKLLPSHDKLKKRPKKHKDRDAQGDRGGKNLTVEHKPEITRITPSEKEPDAHSDDVAFAQQLSRMQNGTELRAPERNAQRIRTTKVKTGKQEKGWQSSETTSSLDGDAEDDTPLPAAPAPTGVEDMLETPILGPATLRVIASEKPQHEPAYRKAKPVIEQETRKQRQRRRRREEEKEQAAHDEMERRRLMEKQLKTARTLEGTAKSGHYHTYTPPPTNAWVGSKSGGGTPHFAPVGNDALLDTFEAEAEAGTGSFVGPVDNGRTHNARDGTAVEPSVSGHPHLDAPSDESRPSLDSEPASSIEGSIETGHHEPVIADLSSDPVGTTPNTNAWENYQMRAIEQRAKKDDGWTEVSIKGKKKVVN